VARRLLALFVVASLAGALAGLTASARAERPTLAAGEVGVTVTKAPCPIPGKFRTAFVTAARDTGLPLELLVAVAYEESQMNPHAESRAGAVGLLQLLPSTASELRADPLHPPSNVRAGARYLRQMFDQFGSTELALVAYNAGPTAVANAGGAPSAQTLQYAAKVQARWRSLAGCR
jgi:soluble lytic murein transglycosylase-like protein